MAHSERARPSRNSSTSLGCLAISPPRTATPRQRQHALPSQAEFVLCEQTIYGRFSRSRCVQVLRHVNEALGKWAQRKYTRFRRRERAAMHWLGRIARRDPDLFVLWRQGVRPEVGV